MPASWSSGNAFVSEAGSPKFESQAGQIEHCAANGLSLLGNFFERSYVACRRNNAEMGPANSSHASVYFCEYNERFDLIDCN